MRTHLRKLMGKNDGMTLVEVIVALVLFSMVFLILLYGINGALKVMGNAQAISDATQSDSSALESLEEQLAANGLPTPSALPNKLTMTSGTINQTIPGTFKVAKSVKVNDSTELSLTLFDADTIMTKPVQPSTPTPTPSVTVEPETEKEVVVPSKGSAEGDAYYSPDSGKTFLSNLGTVQSWMFDHNASWGQYYYATYGVLKKGVTTSSYTTNTSNEKVVRCEYLQQLYFLNKEPFIFDSPTSNSTSGAFNYIVNFIYIGDGTNKTSTTVRRVFHIEGNSPNYTATQNYASSLTIQGYDNDKTTLLYLPKDWDLNTSIIVDWNPSDYTPPKAETYTLSAGFYEIPAGVSVDILKISYDENSRNTLLGYKKSYDDVKERLLELDITVK